MKKIYIRPVSEITSTNLANSVLDETNNTIGLGTWSSGTNTVDSNSGLFDDDENEGDFVNQTTSLWDE